MRCRSQVDTLSEADAGENEKRQQRRAKEKELPDADEASEAESTSTSVILGSFPSSSGSMSDPVWAYPCPPVATLGLGVFLVSSATGTPVVFEYFLRKFRECPENALR